MLDLFKLIICFTVPYLIGFYAFRAQRRQLRDVWIGHGLYMSSLAVALATSLAGPLPEYIAINPYVRGYIHDQRVIGFMLAVIAAFSHGVGFLAERKARRVENGATAART